MTVRRLAVVPDCATASGVRKAMTSNRSLSSFIPGKAMRVPDAMVWTKPASKKA